MKKGFPVFVFCLLTFISAFGQEVTERSRLGAVIEGAAYISSGALAGRVAFMDCWCIYTCDLAGGDYEKLCSVDTAITAPWPRGIGYIGYGEFAGNFLLASLAFSDRLFMVSNSGALVAEVKLQDFSVGGRAEGMTEISSGAYAGNTAILSHSGPAERYVTHINIFRLEKQSSGAVYAFLVKELQDVVGPYSNDIYSLSIAFLPDDAPEVEYRNHFVVGHVNGMIHVIDEEGVLEASYTGVQFMEGMTYLNGGIHKGKLFITDMPAAGAVVRNLDGSQSTPIPITAGVPGFGSATVTWLKARQQLVGFYWTGYHWQWPMYFLSRPGPGQWHKDDAFIYPHLRYPYNLTDLTNSGTYYLYGDVAPPNPPLPTGTSRFRIHILDSSFQKIEIRNLPSEYSAEYFGRLVYVPGGPGVADRFLLLQPTRVFSFDASFSYPAEIIDLYGKVTGLRRLIYDPDIMRYYALDGNLTLRVFDRNWNLLSSYDLSRFVLRGFNELTKFTSGDLRGNIGLLSGLEQGDNELIAINFEYQVSIDMLGSLSQNITAGGIKSGLAKELTRILSDAIKLVNKKKAKPAINVIQEFQQTVQAQRGKSIPVSLADQWIDFSSEIIRGLNNI
jgi:hypothetical protein